MLLILNSISLQTCANNKLKHSNPYRSYIITGNRFTYPNDINYRLDSTILKQKHDRIKIQYITYDMHLVSTQTPKASPTINFKFNHIPY